VDTKQRTKRLSELLGQLLEKTHDKNMTLGIFIKGVGSQAQALFSLIFSVPFLVLVSLPGISTFFGLIILFFGIRLAIGKEAWIPKRLQTVSIGGPRFYKIFSAVCKLVTWMEKLTRPRWAWVFSWPFSNTLQGILLAINGLCLALPLPPGTNLPPAVAAATLSMGILEKDGLWVLLGYFFFITNAAFFLALFWFGKHILGFLLLSS